jgi:hypothetical protein
LLLQTQYALNSSHVVECAVCRATLRKCSDFPESGNHLSKASTLFEGIETAMIRRSSSLEIAHRRSTDNALNACWFAVCCWTFECLSAVQGHELHVSIALEAQAAAHGCAGSIQGVSVARVVVFVSSGAALSPLLRNSRSHFSNVDTHDDIRFARTVRPLSIVSAPGSSKLARDRQSILFLRNDHNLFSRGQQVACHRSEVSESSLLCLHMYLVFLER